MQRYKGTHTVAVVSTSLPSAMWSPQANSLQDRGCPARRGTQPPDATAVAPDCHINQPELHDANKFSPKSGLEPCGAAG